MTISNKRLLANRRNLAIGREKSKETWKHIKEDNHRILTKEFVCEHCGKLFVKDITVLDFKNNRFPRFCSTACAHSRIRSAELRERLSKMFLNKKGCGGILIETTPRLCKNCGKPLGSNQHTRAYCSDKCRIEYRTRCRDLKYDESYQNYRTACEFKFNLSDYPDEFDFELIKKYGWYSPKNKQNNLNGVSRDHMYSVKAGYINKVPSTLLEHPANCKLITHTQNSSKGKKCSITLEELKTRISIWEQKYGKYTPSIWANPNQIKQ